MLDSQTTDSQFEFARPPSAKIADKSKELKQDSSHNGTYEIDGAVELLFDVLPAAYPSISADSESYGRGSTASPEALANESPVSSGM